METVESKKKVKRFDNVLEKIEIIGNKLPHPIALFGILAIAVIIISALCSKLGISATGELVNTKTMKLEEQTVKAVSLLNRNGLAYIFNNAISNFTSYAPLGIVLVAMLGIGTADGSGYITTVLKKAMSISPKGLITPMVVFLGVMSNLASDAGYAIMVPLGALIFLASGRHPLAGFAAAFAGVSGGYSANLFIGSIDPTLAGISTEAARMIDPSYYVAPSANWYFMIASTFLLTFLGTIITDRVIEPRLGKYESNESVDYSLASITDQEKKALKLANLSMILFIVLIVLIAIPQNSFFRDAKSGSLLVNSPLMNGFVVLVSLLFFIPGIVYGRKSGKYKNHRDICAQLGKNMASMGGYIALAFVASQFIRYFSYTNLGTIIALNGAKFLKSTGFNGTVLILCFILFCAFINLFMASASAKWVLMAPIFVPMFMKLNFSPELIQVAYRIGDSSTNIISPVMAYLAMMITIAKKYDEKAGIGTLASMMIPYSITFLIGWAILLVIWIALGLPIGPGAPMTF